ncbi:MAG TPA: class I SAM-dependent methyltransferase [Candidatus Aquicultor sp.]|jgi:methyltransferase (TIGR00027 family)
MQANQVSITALITAYARAYHATHADPKIFDDFLAHGFFTEEERTFFGHNLAESLAFFDPELAASCPDEESALASVMRIQSAPTTISRGRYTEDSLEAAIKQGVKQYVILGAGMDTFAFRKPELVNQLEVFEVDQASTQDFKRQRLAELGWDIPEQLHFVPVDFTKESLEMALASTSYDPQALSFFSWLGVTFYLTREVVFDTLRTITNVASTGSTLIFDYLDTDAFIPEKASKITQKTLEIVRRAGEPMKAAFDPRTLGAELAGVALCFNENLSPDDLEERYFKGRTDGYHAAPHTHFAQAVVV